MDIGEGLDLPRSAYDLLLAIHSVITPGKVDRIIYGTWDQTGVCCVPAFLRIRQLFVFFLKYIFLLFSHPDFNS